ncbi:MAG TPA: nitroreductase family protein [Solirubrobacteraceae bacterium]|jgi:nitroreductase|nr:nitroreductase family protein [Solirubrobacteraceae bacterium]
MTVADTGAPAVPPVPSWADRDPYPALLEIVRHRRSVRRFEPGRRVPRETLRRIMEAGRWAPSGANAQPWDFICVDDADIRARVQEVFLRQGARLRSNVERFPAVNKSFLANTVAIILVLGDERYKACFPQGVGAAEPEYAANNENIFFCSLGAAIQNIQLATIACGLTSAWLSGGGEEQTAGELREILHFPDTARPYGTVPIGYPARYPDSKWRRPLEQVIHWNRFEPEQYRPQELVDHYAHELRPFAMYRPFASIDEWDDADERAGEFRQAYTGRVTNPGGVIPPDGR